MRSKRVITAVAVGIVAAAIASGIAAHVVEPGRRDALAVTPDCPSVDKHGQCVGSTVMHGPPRSYAIVVLLGGIAGSLAFAVAYRRGRPRDVPEARVSR